MEGILGKNVSFGAPSWLQVGPKTEPKRDKKGAKKGTYVKIPLGTQLGPNLGSFWGRFGVNFGVDFGVVLKCFCCSRFFCFFFLLLVGSDFSFVFPWENVVEAMREAHGRRPLDMLKMASEGTGMDRELLDYIPQLLFFSARFPFLAQTGLCCGVFSCFFGSCFWV